MVLTEKKPIVKCAWCADKNNDAIGKWFVGGKWINAEIYHTQDVSHGICHECKDTIIKDIADRKLKNGGVLCG